MEENSASGIPKETDLQVYALSGKIMLYSVIALTLLVLLIICLHFYARRRRYYAAASSNRHHHLTTICRPGLDSSVLKSIPTFSFSSVSHPPEADCAVCLSQFEQSDTGRVLPDCGHFFHTECIDTWFRSHSNCPLCRAPVRSSRKLKTSEIVIEIGEYCSRNEIGVSGECGCSAKPGILLPVESEKMKSVNLPAGTWVGSGEGGSV